MKPYNFSHHHSAQVFASAFEKKEGKKKQINIQGDPKDTSLLQRNKNGI